MTLAGDSAAPNRRWGRRLGKGPTAVFALLGLGALTVIAVPTVADSIGPLTVMLGNGAAAVLTLRNAPVGSSRARAAWRLIGAGFGVSAIGILIMAILDTVVGPMPAFGPMDMVFLSAYLLLLTGFAFLPHLAESRTQRIKTYLDGAIGAIAIAVVAWVLVLEDTLRSLSGASGWERWAGSAYPTLDLVALIMLTLIVSRRTALRFDLRIVFLGVGMVGQVVGDLTYFSSGVGQSFADTHPNFLWFILAAAGYFAASTIVRRQPKLKEYADRPAAAWPMATPYIAAATMVAVVAYQLASTDIPQSTRNLLRTVVLIGVLVVARQALAIRNHGRVLTRQRGELVASISHELRTPLTSIVGYLDMLADGSVIMSEEERRELTAIVSQQAHYMVALVSDLVDLRIEGRAAIDPENRLERMAALVSRSIHAVDTEQVAVALEVGDGLEAFVDGRRIQQILVNLVSNAIRYGGNTVLVRAVRQGSSLVLEVHDNGPGVAKKWELSIWNRFERGPQRFNASQGGTGLGLAVVADITASYGGDAGYSRSDRLGGSCFRVVLPGRIFSQRAMDLAPAPI